MKIDGRRTDTKVRLIKFTAKEIKKNGYKGISQRELAKKFGIAHTAFYNHFENKDDLFRAVLKYISADSFKKYQAYLRENGNPSSALDEVFCLLNFITERFIDDYYTMEFLFLSPQSVELYANPRAYQYYELKLSQHCEALLLRVYDEQKLTMSREDFSLKSWCFLQGYILLAGCKIIPQRETLFKSFAEDLILADRYRQQGATL